MYRVRRWSVRHAGVFERLYEIFEDALVRLDPLLSSIGYARLERPVAMVERVVKGFLFDCRMCGQCVLSSTGMSCPMNCPKDLRNGPCGGVRPDGNCEVLPGMRCVWVEAWPPDLIIFLQRRAGGGGDGRSGAIGIDLR